MIKKLFSQTFYSFFFLILLMINGVDAMAAAADDETVTFASGASCDTTAICGASDGTGNIGYTIAANSDCAASNEIAVKLIGPNGIYRTFNKCNGSSALTKANLAPLCIFLCQQILLAASGNIADEKYSINQNNFAKSMCNALRVVTGSAGKTFAAFAIIATGIGFFTGKVSWGLMIGVTAGIATMFGAPSIVAAISGQDMKTSCKFN